jgi:Fur family ferric uptake transcriptional regulator
MSISLMPIQPELRDKILRFMQIKGARITSQRISIIEAAFNTEEHYTAEELLDMVKKIDRSVSRATVYRTLPLLVEGGYLHELDLGRGQTYYDPNYIKHPNHNHLICVDCDKIIEFEDENLEKRENAIMKRLGFTPNAKQLHIKASCEKMREKGSCVNAKNKGVKKSGT